MNSVNLIPHYRRQAKARKSRLFHWTVGLFGYGVLLLLAYLATVRHATADSRPLEAERCNVSAQLGACRQALTALAQELSQAQRRLRTAQEIGQQPDWSCLLSLLSRNTDESVVLDRCRLRPAPGVEKAPAAPAKPGVPEVAGDDRPAAPLILDLDGFALAQSNVSEYVLRLEKTGLFGQVKLVKTSRQDFLAKETVAFSLECTFGSQGGKAQ